MTGTRLFISVSVFRLVFCVATAHTSETPMDRGCPQNFHAPAETITDRSLLLLWDKPADYNSATFKCFRVFCDGKQIVETAKMGHLVTGLLPKSTHNFQVAMFTTDDRAHAASPKLAATTQIPGDVIDVTTCGAVGDGSTVSTVAIQRAIARCPPGGTVLLPAGIFVSGALFLKSNMTLRIDGTLKGSANLADYIPLIPCRFEGMERDCYPSLLTLGHRNRSGPCNISRVVISGTGTIDASGYELMPAQSKASGNRSRGRAICLMNAQDVCIQGLTVCNGPAWTIHSIYSKNLTFSGLKILSKDNSRRIANGDGIDPDSSSNVNIFDCSFTTGDDSIAIKSGKNLEGFTIGIPTEHVRVTDCVIERSMGGIVIGSEMSGSIRDVQVENCTIRSIAWEGLDIKSNTVRGGTVENVAYRDVTIQGARSGIRLTTGYNVNNDGTPAPMPPRIAAVTYRNVRCDKTDEALLVTGSPQSIISNIILTNCTLQGTHGAVIDYAGNIDLVGTRILSTKDSSRDALSIRQ